jgi:hypothetical protein
LAVWASLTTIWVVFAALMAIRGPDLLHWIHFDDPDPERRARAIQVHDLHQTETAGESATTGR